MDNDAKVPLTRAAQILGLSREVTLRHVLAGRLRGEQIVGRWLVERASVDQMRQEREESLTAVAV
jgi:hypothetical protein